MCGISGFFAVDGQLSKELLETMNRQIWRRGPDGEGMFHNGRVGLAMRRLSIIDLTGGWQPIWNEDRTVGVVYNGEIYNYRQLRVELDRRGHHFQTASDTEVIVHLYEEYGSKLVDHLEGMFGFALWDAKTGSVLLARDRLGIKPLFYARTKQGWFFGSEIKSILATGLVADTLNPVAVDQFFTFTNTSGEETFYANIKKLQPGCTMRLDASGAHDISRYWRLASQVRSDLTENEWLLETERRLQEAVEAHLVSDVPVGAFLSGGVDSGLVVAMMARALDKPVETFTVGFQESGAGFIDERVYARMLTKKYNLNYHEIDVEPHVDEIIDDIVAAFDEPFADDSVIPSYYVSKVTAQHVKVAVSGLGGDELFGGYRRHLGMQLSQFLYATPAGIRKFVGDSLVRRLPEPKGSNDRIDHLKRFVRAIGLPADQRYLDMLSTLSASERMSLYSAEFQQQVQWNKTAEVICAPFGASSGSDLLEKVLSTDIATYLVDDVLTLSDRLSMWHSLELRVPFLHHPFVEHCASIPSKLKIKGFTQKYLLKQIALRWLPRELVNHKKQGFEAPMGRWLRGPLLGYFDSVVTRMAVESAGVLDYETISRYRNEHLTGRRKHSKLLFSVLMFQLWHKAKRGSR